MERKELLDILDTAKDRGMGACLEGSNLSMMVLDGLDMSWADLSGADLSASSIRYADLKSANLCGANLDTTQLVRTDLSDADLSGANLTKANLTKANLSDANLAGAQMHRAKLHLTSLHATNLSGCKGLLNTEEWLCSNFEKSPDGLMVYKAFGRTLFVQDWDVRRGAVLEEVVNPDRTTDCGCGVNFGTLNYVTSTFPNSDIWECVLPPFVEVVVPYNTVGKARCAKLVLSRRMSKGVG